MNRYLNLLWLILALMVTQAVQAETIEDLMAAGELEANIVLETSPPLIQKAPIIIGVEVGTPYRFKGNIRVRDFTVPGTLVHRAAKSALNETRRRGGDSWAFQILRFRLYPEHAGTLTVPPITTFVSVETETKGVVEGELSLQLPVQEIEAAPGTEGLKYWVAATSLEVEESWEGTLESYQVGDAIIRIRRFTIDGVPAMAIPESPRIKIDGLQTYDSPPLVNDKIVGTTLQGEREERVVFTIEEGGSKTIPGHQIHWFNLKSGTVELIELPERILSVPGTGKAETATAQKPTREKGNLLLLGLILLGAGLAFLLLRWLLRTTWFNNLLDQIEIWRNHRRTKAAFMAAAAEQDSRRCLALLYQRMSVQGEWQLSAACANDQQLSNVSAALMAHIYGEGQPPEVNELKRLWEGCTTLKKQQEKRGELRLNPEPSK